MKRKIKPNYSFCGQISDAWEWKTKGLVMSLMAIVLVGISAFKDKPAIQYAQTKKTLVTEEWVLDATVSNVKFYHKIVQCGERKAVLLKFVNTNKQNIKVSWKEAFVTKQVPQETNGFFGEKVLVLLPGETSPSDCTSTSNPDFVILPQEVNPTYLADITNFNFKDISIISAQ